MERTSTEVSFLWFIENYSFYQRKSLISPIFKADELEKTAWALVLYPRGHEIVRKSFISLHLQRSSIGNNRPDIISVEYELSIVTEDRLALASEEYNHSFQEGQEHGSSNFLEIDESLYRRNFPQDVLTVCCRLRRKGKTVGIQRVAPICARTQIGIENISFVHVVENFSKLLPDQKEIIDIQSHLKNKCTICCNLYFINDSYFAGKIIFEIISFSDNICKQKISLHSSENKILCCDADNRFSVVRESVMRLPLSVTRNDILNKKSKYLPGDKLTLSCECSFFTGVEFNEIEEIPGRMFLEASKPTNNQEPGKNIYNAYKAYPTLSGDIKSFFMNESLANVKLKTKTKSFPAHKLVLCARSPVFSRMLTINMREENTGCIIVDDLSNDVVEQLLLFLYSDAVMDLEWGVAIQLYYAADKYEVERLKAVCSSFLVKHLTPSNAGELLLLADTHSDTDLKRVIQKFILKHDREVFGSDEWEILLKKNSQLAAETMHLKYKKKSS